MVQTRKTTFNTESPIKPLGINQNSKVMFLERLSKEYVIKKVEEYKELIRDATDRLSETLYEFRKQFPKEFDLNEEFSLKVRKILHEIVSQVSNIGGFCDGWTRGYIDKTVTIIGTFTSKRKISVFYSMTLELWAMRINAITPDYNKTPFRLSDLKPLASILENILKSFGNKTT